MSGLYLSLVSHHSVPSYMLLRACDGLVAFHGNQMAGIAPVPFSNHVKCVSCATLSTEHPQSSVLRFVGGVGGGSLKNIIPPYSHIIGLQCSHVPLIIWACFPVYSNGLGVCNEAIGGLHSGFYMNLNRLTYVFCRFVLIVFWGMAIPPKICHHKGAWA